MTGQMFFQTCDRCEMLKPTGELQQTANGLICITCAPRPRGRVSPPANVGDLFDLPPDSPPPWPPPSASPPPPNQSGPPA